MVQRKAILVPVDFTDAARHAVRNAIELGKQLQSDVYLINFIPPSRTSRISGDSDGSIRSNAIFSSINLLRENQLKLGELLGQMDTAGVTIHSEIKIDKLSVGIKKQFKAKDIQLMVIGVSEAHTIGDFFCKKQPADVCIKVDCPVLICNNHSFSFKEPHNIVVSLDVNTLEGSNIENMAEIASRLSSKVCYIHVNKPTDQHTFSVEELVRYLKFYKLKANDFKVIESNDKEGAILNYAHERDADLIAVSEFLKPDHPLTNEHSSISDNLVFVY